MERHASGSHGLDYARKATAATAKAKMFIDGLVPRGLEAAAIRKTTAL